MHEDWVCNPRPHFLITMISHVPNPKIFRETYFTRGTLYLEPTLSLVELATQCREKFAFGGQPKEEAEKWAKEKFTPHLSLVYSKLWPVPEKISRSMEHDVITANIGISCSSKCCDTNLEATMSGWIGGRIVLVSIP